MKCKHLIGITGYGGSGKGAASEILAQRGFTRMKFAGPLKAAMRSMLREAGVGDDLIDRMIEGDLKEVGRVELGGASPREFMQWLGTEARNEFGEQIWVNMAIRAIMESDSQAIVFDDVRFENEAAAIRGLGGVIVEMHREGVGPVNDHPSERTLEGDAVCLNNGGIDNLREDMDELIAWVSSRALAAIGEDAA